MHTEAAKTIINMLTMLLLMLDATADGRCFGLCGRCGRCSRSHWRRSCRRMCGRCSRRQMRFRMQNLCDEAIGKTVGHIFHKSIEFGTFWIKESKSVYRDFESLTKISIKIDIIGVLSCNHISISSTPKMHSKLLIISFSTTLVRLQYNTEFSVLNVLVQKMWMSKLYKR